MHKLISFDKIFFLINLNCDIESDTLARFSPGGRFSIFIALSLSSLIYIFRWWHHFFVAKLKKERKKRDRDEATTKTTKNFIFQQHFFQIYNYLILFSFSIYLSLSKLFYYFISQSILTFCTLLVLFKCNKKRKMFNSPSSFLFFFSIIESNRIDNKHFKGNDIILVEERREKKQS